MPSYYDSSEAREGTKLPQNVIDYGKPYPELEAITGADFIVFPHYLKSDIVRMSKKPVPVIANELKITIPQVLELKRLDHTDILIEYIASGALLVQRKSGMDLLQSLGNRLNDCIARMNLISARAIQRRLLYTGIFEKTNDEQLILNGKCTNYNYWSFQGALTKFIDRGGIPENLPSDNDILKWIQIKERHLNEYLTTTEKLLYYEKYYPQVLDDVDDTPFQLPVVVKDGRLALNQFPGLGPSMIQSLYEYIKEVNRGIPPTLYQMLVYATSWETAKNIKGWGDKTIKNNRDFIGLGEGQYLALSNNNITIQKE